jgi:hypothetical protein
VICCSRPFRFAAPGPDLPSTGSNLRAIQRSCGVDLPPEAAVLEISHGRSKPPARSEPHQEAAGFRRLREKLRPDPRGDASTIQAPAATTRDFRSFAQVVMAGGATARPKPGGAAPASSRDAPTGLRNLAGRVHGAGRHGGGEQGRGRGRGRDSAGHGVPAGRRGSAAGANSAATVEVHGNVRPRADAQDESKGNQKSRTLQEPAAKKKKIVDMCYLLGRTFHEHLPSTSWS